MTKSMPPWMGKGMATDEPAAPSGAKAPAKPFGKDMGRKAPKRGARKTGRGAGCR